MNMAGTSKARDSLVWLSILVLVAAGIWANHQYAYIDIALRLIGWLVLALVAVGIAMLTSQGKAGWDFAKASRTELRKVVWPNRQETLQTTGMVVVLVIVVAMIIWGIDTVFLHVIGWLTGQR
tara:strand:- start:18479 stop:18847 length:369 start_codon:yes stop_codon:yes gene_type:complete